MLYIATDTPTQNKSLGRLTIESVDDSVRANLNENMMKPCVSAIVEHSCSCCFPSLQSSENVEFFEGMLGTGDEREEQIDALRDLISIVDECLKVDGSVELFPVWNGDEALPPQRRIKLTTAEISPEKFFFVEQHLYFVGS